LNSKTKGPITKKANKLELQREYINPNNNFETFFDEGGYVFEFDDEKMLLLEQQEEDSGIELDMETFLDATLNEQFWVNLAILGVDWVMYNPNYDFIVYNALLF